ncbi:MAG: hypothetical protein ACRDWE_13600 [Acidimicrobiales bacterium]
MSVSLDTAELPASLPVAHVVPLEVPDVEVAPSRAERRHSLRQLRRERRLYALGGVAALTSFLGLTIYVVDVVR